VRANSLKPEEKLKPKELNHKAIIHIIGGKVDESAFDSTISIFKRVI